MQIDRYDRQILAILQADGRISNQDLADRIGLSPSPCLRRVRVLEESGLGNHPEVIRVFYRAGKAISEDRFVAGQAGKTNQGDARRLYAASNMNP